MSIEVIHKVILHPFVKESVSSLSSMANLQGKSGFHFLESVSKFKFTGYAVCSEVHGALNGVILMHLNPETALEIGARVYEGLVGHAASEINSLSDDLSNALAEWGNTIVGRATNVLAHENLGFGFSAPETVTSLDDIQKYLQHVEKIITVPITIKNVGRFFFTLFIRYVIEDPIVAALPDDNDLERSVTPLRNPLPVEAKILLVDDSLLIRKAMRRYLGKLGYHNTIEASDGNEAVIKVADEKPDFLFMDIVMDQMNGNEALEIIRKTNSKLPIIMLSSVSEKDVILGCYNQGIQGFVLKPLQNNTALQILSHCLGR